MMGKRKVSTVPVRSPFLKPCLWVTLAGRWAAGGSHQAQSHSSPGSRVLFSVALLVAIGRQSPGGRKTYFYLLEPSHWPAIFIGSYFIVTGHPKEMFSFFFNFLNFKKVTHLSPFFPHYSPLPYPAPPPTMKETFPRVSLPVSVDILPHTPMNQCQWYEGRIQWGSEIVAKCLSLAA